jgi:ribonucleoside-diphosphate reductase beta chain
MRKLFEPRVSLKPYEYPELEEYVNAIRHSYWVHTEFNYTSDIQDFKVGVTDKEREIIKRALLAISQIEVAVKSFWAEIQNRFPKPEVAAVGATFAESEVRHMDAYSHLIELLGLDEEFAGLAEVKPLQKRQELLSRMLKETKDANKEDHAKAVLLFALFTEHISLFSQFLIVMSFNKYRNQFKGTSNAVEATSKEEQIHGLFGIELFNLIRKETPEALTPSWREDIQAWAKEIYEAEAELVDWIMNNEDLSFLKVAEVKAFIKNRINKDLLLVDCSKVFEVQREEIQNTEWFDNEVVATKHVDFFHKRSINYNKRSKSVTGNDLF